MVDFAVLRLEHDLSMRKLERDVEHMRHQSQLNLHLAYRNKAKPSENLSQKPFLNSDRQSNYSLASNQSAKSKQSSKSSQSTTSTGSKKTNHSSKSIRSNLTNRLSSCSSMGSKRSSKWTSTEPETLATAKMYKLFFDLSRYTPTEITVRVVGEYLCIYARHEGVLGKKYSFREFERKHRLPPNCDPLLMRASLSLKGLLTVYAFTYN